VGQPYPTVPVPAAITTKLRGTSTTDRELRLTYSSSWVYPARPHPLP
jgi:hypothetical protein